MIQEDPMKIPETHEITQHLWIQAAGDKTVSLRFRKCVKTVQSSTAVGGRCYVMFFVLDH